MSTSVNHGFNQWCERSMFDYDIICRYFTIICY